MDSEWALEVMHKAPYITVSFIDEDGKPYGLPLSLASDDDMNWYFHGALEGKKLEELYKQASMDDLADILYTSGTTGDSKGVMLTYSQYYAALKANDECVPVTEKDRVIDFLPFTHIFEQVYRFYRHRESEA